MKLSPFCRFKIEEESMSPNFRHGVHVLTFNWGKIRVGNVAVFADSGHFYLKRVKRIGKNKVYLESDNKRASNKMWHVLRKNIIGRVILKY